MLAAFAHLTPADAQEIPWVIRPEAITDPYRRAVFGIVNDMACDGRPIDELTLDWAIAERGLPLQVRGGGATFGQRLARIPVSLQEALIAARELQAQQEQTNGGRAQNLGNRGRQALGGFRLKAIRLAASLLPS